MFPRVTVRGPCASHSLRVQGQASCPGEEDPLQLLKAGLVTLALLLGSLSGLLLPSP